MSESAHVLGWLILLIGALVAASTLVRSLLSRTWLPPLVSFLAIGFVLRLAEERFGFLGAQGELAFELLAQLGIIALLFRVGLESNVAGLLEQLPRASVVWIGNIVLSAVPGYVAMTLMGFGPIPSLIAATALTATSIGVSLDMWRQNETLDTREGRLLTDVAELDDLSGVFLMALVFTLLPALRDGADLGSADWPRLFAVGGGFLLKLLAFTSACLIFARYLEQRLTAPFEKHGGGGELLVLVTGLGILIAGAAAAMGFSAAIGALFAGFAFSRDPEAVKIDTGFHGLYLLFTPFFFIGIGLSVTPEALGGSLAIGAALAAVAILGKLVGAGLPSLVATGTAGATLIGISMAPRAEITMVIIERGRQLGDWAVPPELHAGFVLVVLITCILPPLTLGALFRRWRSELGEGRSR